MMTEGQSGSGKDRKKAVQKKMTARGRSGREGTAYGERSKKAARRKPKPERGQ